MATLSLHMSSADDLDVAVRYWDRDGIPYDTQIRFVTEGDELHIIVHDDSTSEVKVKHFRDIVSLKE